MKCWKRRVQIQLHLMFRGSVFIILNMILAVAH